MTKLAINNPATLGPLASSSLGVAYTDGETLNQVIGTYLASHLTQSELGDFAANCLPMMNLLVGCFLTDTLKVDVSGSVFMKNASSDTTCVQSSNGFAFDQKSNELRWGNDKYLDMSEILGYLKSVVSGTLSEMIDGRLGFCSGSRLNNGTVLTDEVFLAVRNLLMGMD
jgi:hypothetical protein